MFRIKREKNATKAISTKDAINVVSKRIFFEFIWIPPCMTKVLIPLKRYSIFLKGYYKISQVSIK